MKNFLYMDLNRDGRQDLVMTQRIQDRVRILWGQSGGMYSMGSVQDLAVGRGPTGLALADAERNEGAGADLARRAGGPYRG